MTATTGELPSLRHLARQTLARLLHGAPVRLPDGSWCSRGSSSATSTSSPQSASTSVSVAGTGSLPSPPVEKASVAVARHSLPASFPATMPFIGQSRGGVWNRWVPHVRVSNLLTFGNQLLPFNSSKKQSAPEQQLMRYSSPSPASAAAAVTSRSHEALFMSASAHQCVPTSQDAEHVDDLPDAESLQEMLSGSTHSLPPLVAASSAAQAVATERTRAVELSDELEEATRAERVARSSLFQPDVAKKLRSYVLFTNDDKFVLRFQPRALPVGSEVF